MKISASNSAQQGFTLIELLVVVSIIVVLLALLAPAMDQAIYQSQLAVCGARLKALGASVVLYTMDHDRTFPARDRNPDGSAADPHREPHLLRWSVGSHDVRANLNKYMSINNTLQCSVTPQVDLSDHEGKSTGKIYGSYYYWFGWQYSGHAGMKKLGQRFGWTDTSNVTGVAQYRFSLLASDHDVIYEPDRIAHGSHPDNEGQMSALAQQGSGGSSTYAKWQLLSTPSRPPVDLNFAYQDGSTRRLNRVLWKFDPRIARVAHWADGLDFDNKWGNIPKE